MGIQSIMREVTMSQPPQPSTEIAVGAPMSAELARQFAQMAMMVPSETGDAVENILAAILASPSWENLSDPWEAKGAEKLAGKVIRIDSVMRRPSDFKDGLGVFLVVHSADTTTGESVTWTTSSFSIIAQLVRAYAMSWLPLYAMIVVAERQTERGYRPHHLKFLGKSAPAAPAEPVF